jgi:hypothetical protein
VSPAETHDARADLRQGSAHSEADPNASTHTLIAPRMLDDFLDYNDSEAAGAL